MSKFKSFAKYNWGVLFELAWFLMFFIFNLNSLPYLDANFDLVKSLYFLYNGLIGLVNKYGSIMHPPLKDFLLFSLYKFGLDSVVSFHLFVLPFLLLGIVSIKRISARIFNDNRSGNVAAAILGAFPIFVTIGTQNLNDFLVCCLKLYVLASYLKRRYFQLSVGLTLAVLFKETNLIMLPILVVYEVFKFARDKRKENLIGLISSLILPVIFFSAWYLFLWQKGYGIWSHYVFDSSVKNNAIQAVIQKTLAFDFNNQYFIENIKHLLMLNFNWLIVGLSLVSVLYFFRKSRLKECGLLLVYFLFHLLVLNFPTYTIPRYVLPVIVIPIILCSGIMAKIKRNNLIAGLIMGFGIISGFTSVDPISNFVWKAPMDYVRFWVFYQNLYFLNPTVSGNDRITYNQQYLLILLASEINGDINLD